MLSVVTWNVNSINMRKNQVYDLITKVKKESNNNFVIMLQELKCDNEKFPNIYEGLVDNIVVHGQKQYNGVAILTSCEVVNTSYSFQGNPCEDESRYLEVELLDNIVLINIYVPNGTSLKHVNFNKKLGFLKGLINRLDELNKQGKMVIIGGDFNVAPFDLDVYNVSDMKDTLSFTIQEKILIRQMMNIGYIDLYRVNSYNKCEFSWWDYRGGSLQNNLGLRIDYFLCNKPERFEGIDFLKDNRYLEQPSDHIPIKVVVKDERRG